MDSWGLDLSQSALKALPGGLGHALPYLLMVVVVVGLTYLQHTAPESSAEERRHQPDPSNSP